MHTLLITGANRGIGLEFVKQYAQLGWHIIACCRHPQAATELQTLSQDSPSTINILPLDLLNTVTLSSLKQTLRDTPIDLLINNAGILGKFGKESVGHFHESPENAQEIFQVNVLGPLFLSEYLIPNLMKGQLKTIINISSDWGSIALNESGEACLYRASKSALNSITKTLSLTLKDKGIKIVAIHPGWVKTNMGGANATISTEESVNAIRALIHRLSEQDTGRLMKRNGEELPW